MSTATLPSATQLLVKNQNTLDAATVFFSTALAQFLVPAPLDSLLLPAAVTYWYVATGQSFWLVEKVQTHGQSVVSKAYAKLAPYLPAVFSATQKLE